MELLSFGSRSDRLGFMKDACIAYCRMQRSCVRCPLRTPICNNHQLITEWNEEELREAFRIIGDSKI